VLGYRLFVVAYDGWLEVADPGLLVLGFKGM
jgi:hypothetical protein